MIPYYYPYDLLGAPTARTGHCSCWGGDLALAPCMAQAYDPCWNSLVALPADRMQHLCWPPGGAPDILALRFAMGHLTSLHFHTFETMLLSTVLF